MATIKDVASKSDVSIATVSRVINTPSKVKSSTKKRVERSIKLLRFIPNINAKGLIENKTFLVTLVLPSSNNFLMAEYSQKIIFGINKTFQKSRYSLVVKQDIYKSNETFKTSLSDGYILLAPESGDNFVKEIEDQKVPAVIINNRSKTLDWVDLDNINAAKTVVNYLIEMGHKKIMIICGSAKNKNSSDRLRGYRYALSQNRIDYDPSLVVYADYDMEKAYKKIRNIGEQKKKFTSIFACNDLMAVGAIKALKENNLEVPKDISVVGFDDLSISLSYEPAITTVHQPFVQMGDIAAKIIIEKLEKKITSHVFRELEGKLVLRDSVNQFNRRSQNSLSF